MESIINRSGWCFLIIISLLVACTPITVSPTATPTISNSTAAPALNPVTPTQERLFATASTVTKEFPTNNETENHESNEDVISRASADTDEVVLIYERAGGLKGIGASVFTWTLYTDGRVISSDGRSWQVSPDDITTLLDSIMTLGFADFEASYIPKDTCCDRATHTITIHQGGEVYQVSVLDSTEGVPSELYQALGIINDFLLALPT